MTEERKTLWRLIEAVEACSLDEAVKAVQEASMLLAAKPDLEWSGTFVAPILWNGKVQERRLRVYTPAVDRAALATPSPDGDAVFFCLSIDAVVAFVAGADVSGDGWRNAEPCTPWDRHGKGTLADIVMATSTASAACGIPTYAVGFACDRLAAGFGG